MGKIELMEKVLVAGPTLLTNSNDIIDLHLAITGELNALRFTRAHIGVVCAEDTVTGRFVREWANKHAVPLYGHRAFPDHDARLSEIFYSDRARQLVAQRNEAMMRDRCLKVALLFVQTNECTDFVAGLRQHRNQVDIRRVCA